MTEKKKSQTFLERIQPFYNQDRKKTRKEKKKLEESLTKKRSF